MIARKLIAVGGLALLLLLGAGSVFAPAASARPGQLDPDFGAGGRLLIDGGTSPANWDGDDAVAVGDRLFVGASVSRFGPEDRGDAAAVLKLTEAGPPDPAFGDRGTAVLDLPGRTFPPPTRIAVQPDGRIVIAVHSIADPGTQTMILARLLADGSPDPSFGEQGVAQTALQFGELAFGLALTPDGRIVIAGRSASNGLLAARFLADGRSDPSFSGDGVQVIQVGGGGAANAVAVQPDGRILIAGTSAGDDFRRSGVVARLLANGELDRSFGGDGIVEKRFGRFGGAVIEDLALAPSGKILAIANRQPSVGRGRAVVARLKPNGAVDRSFADGGAWKSGVTNHSFQGIRLAAVILQPNGRVLVAGSLRKQFLIRRFRRSGKPDRSFSRDGRVQTGFGIGRAEVDALALLGDTLVAVGSRSVTSGGGRTFSSDVAAAGYRLR